MPVKNNCPNCVTEKHVTPISTGQHKGGLQVKYKCTKCGEKWTSTWAK